MNKKQIEKGATIVKKISTALAFFSVIILIVTPAVCIMFDAGISQGAVTIFTWFVFIVMIIYTVSGSLHSILKNYLV